MAVHKGGHMAATGRFIMVLARISEALAALLIASGIACAQGKPNDAQIAHIAYTAG
jgi:predicted outer membrane protein